MAFTPLNSLNAYLEVARRRSFAAAARELGVSPSALSQSVRQLEARLGATLLTRTSRSVAPTDAGQRLLEHAGPAVEQALESLKTVSARPGEITGRVRLSVPAVAVSLVLARLLPRFIERYPKIEVEARVEGRFVDIVAEGLDAGIRLTEAIERDMVQVRLLGPGRFRLRRLRRTLRAAAPRRNRPTFSSTTASASVQRPAAGDTRGSSSTGRRSGASRSKDR